MSEKAKLLTPQETTTKEGIIIKSWHTGTICGQKGTGKSTWERKVLLPKFRRLVVFDPNDEFTEFPLWKRGSNEPKVRYVPETDSPQELEMVAKGVWESWNCLLLVSEAELYLPEGYPLRKVPHVFKIITRGRHRNIGLWADTRRIACLSKTVFGLSEHQIIYRHFSPTDMGYLRGFVPTDVKRLASIADFCYWHVQRGKLTECRPVE